jgi:hypothetical protein
MLLAPTGQQSLAALGGMLEVAKVTLREAEWIGIAHGEILCEAGIGITADDAPFAGSSLKLPIEVSQFLIQGD